MLSGFLFLSEGPVAFSYLYGRYSYNYDGFLYLTGKWWIVTMPIMQAANFGSQLYLIIKGLATKKVYVAPDTAGST